jgi:hypothetical protein
LAGVASAVVFWLMTGGALYVYKRRQARSLLLAEVEEQLAEISEAIADLDRLISKSIVVGSPLQEAGKFTPTQCSFFDALRGELLSLFPRDVSRILDVYHTIEVLNCLIESLYLELTNEAAAQNKLTAEDQAYYMGKLIRIMQFVDRIGKMPVRNFDPARQPRNVTVDELRQLIADCRRRNASSATSLNPAPKRKRFN